MSEPASVPTTPASAPPPTGDAAGTTDQQPYVAHLTPEGEQLLADGHPAEAIDVLRRALAAGEPGSADLLVRAYFESGSWQPCIEWLAPQVEQGRVEFAGRLGVAYAELGDSDGAERALRLAVDSGEVVAANDLAILLRDSDRVAEAVYVLTQAVEAGDRQAPANLIELHLEAGELAAAVAAAERYADEARPDTIVALGDVRAAESRPDAAEQAYRRAIELGGARAHTAYGQFLLAAYGDAGGAEGEFREAAQHDEPGWHYTFGRFLIDDGRGDEAREFLEAAAGWGDPVAAELLDEINGIDPTDD